MFAHNNPEMKWFGKVAFFCVNGSHPDSWQQLDNMWKARKWQNVTSVFPCSFNSKTKGLLKSVDGCVRLRLRLPVFSSYFCWHQIHQRASYRYGNHVRQSREDQKKETVSWTQNNCLMPDWSITRNWFAVKDVMLESMRLIGWRGLDRVKGQRSKEVIS